MQSLSFRARKLDNSKPLLVVHDEALLEADGTPIVSRSVPDLPSGMEKEEEKEAQYVRALKNGEVIQIPNITIVEPIARSGTWRQPAAYIRYDVTLSQLPMHEQNPTLEYDLTDSDTEYVSKFVSLTGSSDSGKQREFEPLCDLAEVLLGFYERTGYEFAHSGRGDLTKEQALYSAKHLLDTFYRSHTGLCSADRLWNFAKTIYDYWMAKRAAKPRNGDFLLDKYKKIPPPDDPNPYTAFRSRGEEWTGGSIINSQSRKRRRNRNGTTSTEGETAPDHGTDAAGGTGNVPATGSGTALPDKGGAAVQRDTAARLERLRDDLSMARTLLAYVALREEKKLATVALAEEHPELVSELQESDKLAGIGDSDGRKSPLSAMDMLMRTLSQENNLSGSSNSLSGSGSGENNNRAEETKRRLANLYRTATGTNKESVSVEVGAQKGNVQSRIDAVIAELKEQGESTHGLVVAGLGEKEAPEPYLPESLLAMCREVSREQAEEAQKILQGEPNAENVSKVNAEEIIAAHKEYCRTLVGLENEDFGEEDEDPDAFSNDFLRWSEWRRRQNLLPAVLRYSLFNTTALPLCNTKPPSFRAFSTVLDRTSWEEMGRAYAHRVNATYNGETLTCLRKPHKRPYPEFKRNIVSAPDAASDSEYDSDSECDSLCDILQPEIKRRETEFGIADSTTERSNNRKSRLVTRLARCGRIVFLTEQLKDFNLNNSASCTSVANTEDK